MSELPGHPYGNSLAPQANNACFLFITHYCKETAILIQLYCFLNYSWHFTYLFNHISLYFIWFSHKKSNQNTLIGIVKTKTNYGYTSFASIKIKGTQNP